MVIVIIHWRIKPIQAAEDAFFEFWTKTATISDKTNIAGEFLSAPMPAKDVPFRVDDLTFGHGVLDCWHFMNVGLWKDWQSFHDQVGKHMKDDKDIEPFEADRRTRTVLSPKQWRIGQWALPATGTCE